MLRDRLEVTAGYCAEIPFPYSPFEIASINPYGNLKPGIHPPLQKRMDLLRRRHDGPDGRIMIQGINDDRKVLA